ncbi:IS1380 family transposase [Propionibacterium freudenreichii]|uniref:IS1380 family transposase n=1 Tax=Propionibacterium freudenreichii TaxID=1744 RepID=UPI0006DBF7C4|nr:IS1380 family transposase [Propionibacterium freudenreichii]MDK9653642.1 IS1380 family transposase [Propionibacterium freudenreichii]MDK9662381.1 IS1380 family transposase [Propionibacterium freudenreichii]MDK9676681.1 IS1380 family transposase [Propionibacterium freudenreichii]SCQ47224.1 TnpC protein [Propionibacterium freudenreichii]
MQLSHTHTRRFTPVFDEDHVVSAGGLPAVMGLAQRAGFTGLLKARLTVPSPNEPVKVRALVSGMLAGADTIDGMDILRSGGTQKVVGAVRAPSTLGTHLRSYTHGHTLQLGGINRDLLTNLAPMVPTLFGGDPLVMVDLDDTIREVHGYAKQAVAYGYNHVKGLNALVATISTEHSAPVIAGAQLRRGNVKSGDHAAWHATRALTLAKRVRPATQIMGRADSAFCTCDFVHAFQDAGCWFSVTIPQWKSVTRAISAIREDAWVGIHYTDAVFEEDTGEWISDAEVAEVPFTAFTSHPKEDQVTCRLVVRRVKRLNPTAHADQGELFDTYRYHPLITNSTLPMIQADERHRGHAIIEQVMAELKGNALAHLPSGRFTANAAWLQLAVLAFNISRAAAHAAGMSTARMSTLRIRVTMIPARLARHSRRRFLHYPTHWPWQQEFMTLWAYATGTGPPQAA